MPDTPRPRATPGVIVWLFAALAIAAGWWITIRDGWAQGDRGGPILLLVFLFAILAAVWAWRARSAARRGDGP
jgi:hypothetical protein